MTDLLTTLWGITPARPWGIDIPNYFWFTGSSAAAFIVSSFAHVFGWKKYRPIAGFSLLLAFVLLAVAPLNLVDDLRQPGRVINFFLYGWENFPTSPMKWGVLLLLAYPLLILAEACVLYREQIVARRDAAENKYLRRFYCLLALGRLDTSDAARERDYILSRRLGAAGIPLALSVHGYTGYILGVVHAFPLWHTPLMPILFLASAMVSGTGLLLLLLPVVQKYFTAMARVDWPLMSELTRLLAWFIVLDLVMRFFWLTFAIPFNGSEKYALASYFRAHFLDTAVLEYGIGLFLPLLIGFTAWRRRPPLMVAAGMVSAAGVWLFRWNTVIGGQGLGKTTAGLLQYHVPLWGPDSVATIAANFAAFIAVLCVIMLLFPWGEEMQTYYAKGDDYEYNPQKLPEIPGWRRDGGRSRGI